MQSQCSTGEILFWSLIGTVLIVLIVLGIREIARDRSGGGGSTCGRFNGATQQMRRGQMSSDGEGDSRNTMSETMDGVTVPNKAELLKTLTERPNAATTYDLDNKAFNVNRVNTMNALQFLREPPPTPQRNAALFGQMDTRL